MSRANYSEDLDNWDLIRWRGMVTSATRGKRGQAFFRDLLAALDAMPDKRLITEELQTEEGDVCAMGALAVKRGIDVSAIDPEEPEVVAATFDIAEPLAREVAYMNDEYFDYDTTPEQRWTKMRAWVEAQIKQEVSQ